MTVTTTTNKVVYEGDGVTNVWDFNFPIPAGTAKLTISVDGVESIVPPSEYVVAGTESGAVTYPIGAPLADGVMLVIERMLPYTQETDLTNQDNFYPEVLEAMADRAALRDQQLQEQVDRAVKLPVTASASQLNELIEDIVRLSASANQIDAVANIGAQVVAVSAVTTEVAALGPIAPAIVIVAGIASNVTTVAGVASAVSTLAPRAADIAALGPRAGDIQTVAGIDDDVTTVAGIAANVTTVAARATDIQALAPRAADIQTLAPIAANITTVAGVSAAVTQVAAIAGEVTTLANIASDITALSDAADSINDVAAVKDQIVAVAAIDTQVSTVAGIASDITSVAGIAGDVSTVAQINDDVETVAAAATNVGTVAGIATEVQTVAANVNSVSNFALVYYGPAGSAPTTRSDGSALQSGDLYFNTTDNSLYVRRSGAWQPTAVDPGLYYTKTESDGRFGRIAITNVWADYQWVRHSNAVNMVFTRLAAGTEDLSTGAVSHKFEMAAGSLYFGNANGVSFAWRDTSNINSTTWMRLGATYLNLYGSTLSAGAVSLSGNMAASTASLTTPLGTASGGTGSSSGVVTASIVDKAVTLAKIQDITAGLLGRLTGTGVGAILSFTDVTAALNAFTTTLKGLVPPPGSVTGKFLKDDGTWSLINAGLGEGQTWQDVLASRTGGVTYQNTTGRSIAMAIQPSTGSGRNLQISVDGTTWLTIAQSSGNAGLSFFMVVPNNYYYRISSAGTILSWWELR